MHYHALVYTGAEDLNSGPYTAHQSTFTTKPIPGPVFKSIALILFFVFCFALIFEHYLL